MHLLAAFCETKFAELEKTLFLVAAVCIVTILFIPSLMVNIVFAVIFLLCIALFIASFCFVIYRAYKTKRRDYILLAGLFKCDSYRYALRYFTTF